MMHVPARSLTPCYLVLLVISTALVGGCSRTVKVSDADIQRVSLSEVREKIGDARGREDYLLLIDPRSKMRFEESRIPTAKHIPLTSIDPQAGKQKAISKFEHIIVYGKNPGSAAARAMVKRLLALRYKGVRFYAGGLDEWVANGLPVAGAASEAE